jgi:hypothetical protein
LVIVFAYNLNINRLATLKSVDPEYIHLISAVNLANGEYKLWSIENPGSSLYIYGALVVKITYATTGDQNNLTDDFLSNPEKYIFSFRLGLGILTLISLILMGTIIFRKSGNIKLALFFQSSVFLTVEVLHSLSLVCPENFLIAIMIWYILVLYLVTHNHTKDSYTVLWLSILTGLGLAAKLTFIPLIILPLFLFSKHRHRLYYILGTSIFTLLFAFPVVLQYERFYEWVYGLIFRSGQYGTGEANIVDTHKFWINLLKIFSHEILFSITYFTVIITTIVSYNQQKFRRKEFLFFLAIFLVVSFQMVLTSKHFAQRYLLPSVMLTLFIVYRLSLYYKPGFIKKFKTIPYIFVVLLISITIAKLFANNYKYRDFRESRQGAYTYKQQNIASKPVIIMPNYFSSASVEYALYFSSVWTGTYKEKYFKKLNELYPETYFYFPGPGVFKSWNNNITLTEILSRHNELYFCGTLDTASIIIDEVGDLITKKLAAYNQFGDTMVKAKEVYKSFEDIIFKLKVNSKGITGLYDHNEVIIDMEVPYHVDSPEEVGINFELINYTNLDSLVSFSGKRSQFLSKDLPWGTGVLLHQLEPGSILDVTTWKKSLDDDCLLVAKSEIPNGFYITSNNIVENSDGWQKISLQLKIEDSPQYNPMRVFVWYKGKNYAYVDNLTIRVSKLKNGLP